MCVYSVSNDLYSNYKCEKLREHLGRSLSGINIANVKQGYLGEDEVKMTPAFTLKGLSKPTCQLFSCLVCVILPLKCGFSL